MDVPAAPRPGRRVGFGALVVLAGFLLLAPPLFLLAPFALLTILSRPRTLREAFWLLVAATIVGISVQGPPGIARDVVRWGALALAVGFAILSLRPGLSVTIRALLALLLAVVFIVALEWSRGVFWPAIESAFTQLLKDSYQAVVTLSRDDPESRRQIQAFMQQFIDSAGDLAKVMPALLALQGLAGLALAANWHHKIATRPIGSPPDRFRNFRFNDHLVWGAIVTLALLLAPLPPEGVAAALNLLVLWIGLYALRGLAVAATLLVPAGNGLRVLTAFTAILLSPVALGICLAIGLCDTWLDIRARLASATGGS